MLLKDLAEKHNMTEDELKNLINDRIMEDFIKDNMNDKGEVTDKMVNAVSVLVKKLEDDEKKELPADDISDIPPMDDIPPMEDDEQPEPSDADTESEDEISENPTGDEENAQEIKNTNAESGFEDKPADDEDDTEDNVEDADENNEITDENEDENTHAEEPEKPRVRKKRKTEEPVTIDSDIDEVPAIELRKFLAENFSVKPEKIFFMDDAGVKEKVDERYIVISRNDAFVFIRRTASMIALSK